MPLSRRDGKVASDGLSALLTLTRSAVDGVMIASGVVGGLLWITDTARQFKGNKEDWQEFSEYVSALLGSLQYRLDNSPEAMSSSLSEDISNLQGPLLRIISEMQQMKKRSLLSRVLQTQEDPKKISGFRQMLIDASLKFNTAQLVAIRLTVESMASDTEVHSKKQPNTRIIPKLQQCPLPSHLFVGRNNALEFISQYFTTSHEVSRQRVFILHGLAGSGKSQIAFKFVHLSQSESKRFSEVFMIDATSAETIEGDLKNIALAKGIGDSFQDALEWLATRPSEWLMLFDNADDVHLNLRRYFPTCSHGNILITTRNPAVRLHGSGRCSSFNVVEMESTDAERLLMRILETSTSRSDEMRALVTTLAKELGWFALALVQVGSYIVTSECGVKRYLEMFRERNGKLLEDGFVSTQRLDGYQRSVSCR